jgi:adenosylcobinamide-phosphate synthase
MLHLSPMPHLSNVALALAALLTEAAFGYPAFVHRAIGHPVTWMGGLLGLLETRLNRPGHGRLPGVLALIVLLAVTACVALAISAIAAAGPIGSVVPILAASSLIAQNSLRDHVGAVADALERNGLAGGREAVSKIVGRDPNRLDEAGVARAAIESLAENFSDGIIAPAFWIAIAGLAGGALYKAVNTADSMIGHRTPRHEAFGWAAARLDDLINLPASRLAAVLLIFGAWVTGASPRGAVRALWRDASHHRSPNAGWPEAAMAGALGLRLAGPRIYGEILVEDAFMGDGTALATANDIRRALRLFRAACVASWLTLFAIVIIARV